MTDFFIDDPAVIAVIETELNGSFAAPDHVHDGGGGSGGSVPVGGATGEVLAKVDATDFNTEWVAAQAGPAGADGADGAPGATGAAGADGANGTNGADGADGLGWTGGSYAAGTGIVTFTSTDGLGFATTDLRGADGADGNDGATGATGAAGSDGATGATGAAGADGANGANGADGADGQGVPTGGTTGQVLSKIDGTDFNTEWSTVSGGGGGASAADELTVDDSSFVQLTATDAQAAFEEIDTALDNGVAGPAGADGADGTNGTNGTDGLGWTGGSYSAGTGVVTFTSTDGLGFVTGDLRGADGTNGSDGATGAAGADGNDGATGAAGADGTNGTNGTDGDGFTGGSYSAGTGIVTFTSDDGLGFSTGDLRGADGADGANGNDGADGATGATGATGAAGADGADGAVSGDVDTITEISQAAYDALTPVATTLYLVTS